MSYVATPRNEVKINYLNPYSGTMPGTITSIAMGYIESPDAAPPMKQKNIYGRYYNRDLGDTELFKAPGYTVDIMTVKSIFNDLIGKQWNMKTLIQKGVKVKETPSNAVYVDFVPSAENVAYMVYKIMAPVVVAKANARIAYVEVETTEGNIRYAPFNIK